MQKPKPTGEGDNEDIFMHPPTTEGSTPGTLNSGLLSSASYKCPGATDASAHKGNNFNDSSGSTVSFAEVHTRANTGGAENGQASTGQAGSAVMQKQSSEGQVDKQEQPCSGSILATPKGSTLGGVPGESSSFAGPTVVDDKKKEVVYPKITPYTVDGVPLDRIIALDDASLELETGEGEGRDVLTASSHAKLRHFLRVLELAINEAEADRQFIIIQLSYNAFVLEAMKAVTDLIRGHTCIIAIAARTVTQTVRGVEAFLTLKALSDTFPTLKNLTEVDLSCNATPVDTGCYKGVFDCGSLRSLHLNDGGFGVRGAGIVMDMLLEAGRAGTTQLRHLSLRNNVAGQTGATVTDLQSMLDGWRQGAQSLGQTYDPGALDGVKEENRGSCSVGTTVGIAIATQARSLQELDMEAFGLSGKGMHAFLSNLLEQGGLPQLRLLNLADGNLSYGPVRSGTAAGLVSGVPDEMDVDQDSGEHDSEPEADKLYSGAALNSGDPSRNTCEVLGDLLRFSPALNVLSIASCIIETKEEMSAVLGAVSEGWLKSLTELSIDRNDSLVSGLTVITDAIEAGSLPALLFVGAISDDASPSIERSKLKGLIEAIEKRLVNEFVLAANNGHEGTLPGWADEDFRLNSRTLPAGYTEVDNAGFVVAYRPIPKMGIIMRTSIHSASNHGDVRTSHFFKHIEQVKIPRLPLNMVPHAVAFWLDRFLTYMIDGKRISRKFQDEVKAYTHKAMLAGADNLVLGLLPPALAVNLAAASFPKLAQDDDFLRSLSLRCCQNMKWIGLATHWRIDQDLRVTGEYSLTDAKLALVAKGYVATLLHQHSYAVVKQFLSKVFSLEAIEPDRRTLQVRTPTGVYQDVSIASQNKKIGTKRALGE